MSAARIAALNDALRRSFKGGRVLMTSSIAALPAPEQAAILMAAARFDAFSRDNDPHGEHDCARFEAAGHACLFKVDYYDEAMEFASPDPADPAVTRRVLTIMLAADY